MSPASLFRPFLQLSFTAFLLAAPAASACSTCGCSLSSDWAAQGFTMLPGLEAGLRFEYFDQTDLRSGTGSVSRSGLALPAAGETQQRTLNRNTWLDLNYVVDPSWAVTASVPYLDRFHTTIAAGDTDISSSRASGPGDVRLLARYQRPHARQSFSVQFGFKLPTGRVDQNFADGPSGG